jgi:hypothetical protein
METHLKQNTMNNLFQITAKARELSLALESGELTDELENELVINQTELQEKAINYGYAMRSLESDVSIIDEEMKRLTALKKAKTGAIDRMKESVLNAMLIYGIEKVTSPTLNLSVRNNPESVDIPMAELLDAKFLVTKTTVTPDKVAIKKAIQNGEIVEGATLVRTQSLVIK